MLLLAYTSSKTTIGKWKCVETLNSMYTADTFCYILVFFQELARERQENARLLKAQEEKDDLIGKLKEEIDLLNRVSPAILCSDVWNFEQFLCFHLWMACGGCKLPSGFLAQLCVIAVILCNHWLDVNIFFF